jgi:hypothetical protein
MVLAEQDREEAIASFKDASYIDMRSERRVKHIIRSLEGKIPRKSDRRVQCHHRFHEQR